MGMDGSQKAQLMRFYDGTLLPDEVITAMTGDQGWFPSRTIARGSEVSKFDRLEEGLPPLRIEDHGRVFDLYDYLATNSVAGLLVLKDGRLACEIYQRGITADTLWQSCSLAKSVSATLVGMAVREGAIGSLDDPVAKYLDMGGAYRDVSLRQVLRMNSGVRWNEDYGDPASERRKLLEVQTGWKPGGVLNFMETLTRATPPGKAWVYSTGESYLVSAIMENATGMNLADYLTSRLWSRIGMESDARWWSESVDGMTISGSGMNATLRDYARFGLFVLREGRVGDEQLVPEGWRDEAGSPYEIDGRTIRYGYMWWVPELEDPSLKGCFQAEGIYGQYIHINPARQIVVVVASARSKPSYGKRLEINDDAFFAALARAL